MEIIQLEKREENILKLAEAITRVEKTKFEKTSKDFFTELEKRFLKHLERNLENYWRIAKEKYSVSEVKEMIKKIQRKEVT